MHSFPAAYLGFTGKSRSRSGVPNVFGSSSYAGAYVSNGDSNGLLTFIGKLFDPNGTWSNPHTAGLIVSIRSSDQNGSGVNMVDHASTGIFTTNTANSWCAIDLGFGRAALLNKYSLQMRPGTPPNAIRNWKFQGTNVSAGSTVANLNAATWDDLAVYINDTTIPDTTSAWGTFSLTNSNTYRWFRVLQNGVNASGANFLTIDEIELYGTLFY